MLILLNNTRAAFMFVALFLLGLLSFTAHADDVSEVHAQVELSDFIKNNQPHKKGSKSIVPPKNISFYGKVMQLPEEGKFEYVYIALDLMKVTPTPEVTHQMYIGDDTGKVVSMYVEKHAAEVFNKYLKTGERLHFKGFHIYNYKRGPAIIVEGLVDDEQADGQVSDVAEAAN